MSLNISKILFTTLFILKLISIYTLNYISLKLTSYSNDYISSLPQESFSVSDFLNYIISNKIYTSIKIGTPPQEIKTWIDPDEYSYFLFKDICVLSSKFDEKKSSTFKPITVNSRETFFYQEYRNAFYANETIILNTDINNKNKEISVNNFPFMFMTNPLNDSFFGERHNLKEEITNNSCATIGFRSTKNYRDNISKNFLTTLKQYNIIDSYVIFLIYDKERNEDFLILGGYPEEILPNNYSSKNTEKTYITLYNRFKPQFGLKFDEVISGNNESFYERNVAFHYNLGGILGIMEYEEYIKKNYFNFYLDNKICKFRILYKYTTYVCNKNNFTENDLKKFPPLKLKKSEINETFILDYTDLFLLKDDFYYFLIVFHETYKDMWDFGKPFLKKYFFAFNFDSKLIIYYKETNKTVDNPKTVYYFIIIVLCIILFIVCFLFGRRIYNNRRSGLIRARELEENYGYQGYVPPLNNGNNNNAFGNI